MNIVKLTPEQCEELHEEINGLLVKYECGASDVLLVLTVIIGRLLAHIGIPVEDGKKAVSDLIGGTMTRTWTEKGHS